MKQISSVSRHHYLWMSNWTALTAVCFLTLWCGTVRTFCRCVKSLLELNAVHVLNGCAGMFWKLNLLWLLLVNWSQSRLRWVQSCFTGQFLRVLKVWVDAFAEFSHSTLCISALFNLVIYFHMYGWIVLFVLTFRISNIGSSSYNMFLTDILKENRCLI